MTRLSGAVLALALVLLSFAVSHAQFQPSVVPTLSCVTFHPTTNNLDVFLGYASSHASTVSIPVGAGNFFLPGEENRNQPTVFEPGVHDRVFFTSFTVTPQETELSWSLDGTIVTASNDPNLYCNAPSGPGFDPASLRTVSAASGQQTARAACAINEVLMGGGGSCVIRNGVIHQLGASAPSQNGWEVKCVHRQAKATAFALCAPTP